MSDLDDEELEATRRLNGVAREKDKERTDINVGNIKKDIKRCEQLIKPEHANWIGISNQLAIAHVVDRVKELEEENKKYIVQLTDEQYRNLVDVIRKEVKKEFEQKVKDKIEELKNAKRETTRENWHYIYTIQLKILEELLKGE